MNINFIIFILASTCYLTVAFDQTKWNSFKKSFRKNYTNHQEKIK